MPYRNEKFRIRLLQRLPRAMIEDPFEVFLGLLCSLSGIPLLAGQARQGAVDQLMPHWFSRCWGGTLTLGSVLVIFGLFLHGRTRRGPQPSAGPVRTPGRTYERIGLIILGYASAIYAVAITVVGGSKATPAAAIVTVFCFTCATRAFILSTSELITEGYLRSLMADWPEIGPTRGEES